MRFCAGWRVFAAVAGMAASGAAMAQAAAAPGAAMGPARAQGAGAQAAGAPELARCSLRQVEIYQEGGDAGLGSGEQIVGLRNVSGQRCTLFGVPRLEFFDKAGKRLAIPYGKNEAAMMVEPQAERLVTLEPGGFAYFMIGTTTGDEHLHFQSMRVVLPGDDVPLTVGAWQGELQSIDVSAIVAGTDTDDGWAAPTKRVAATGGSLSRMPLTLDVPDRPRGPFDAHFTLVNTGASPVRIAAKDCSLSGRLTNSAGKVVWENEPCGDWSGEIGADGLLRPGARATADIQVGDLALQLCREGEWRAQFSLNVAAGIVNFAEFPYGVVSTQCSDSEHIGEYVDENAIRWTLIPRHGVRLGVAVWAKGNAEPVTMPLNGDNVGPKAAEFHAGEPIELRLYLDDLTDAPLAWRSGPDAFRVAVRIDRHSEMMPEPDAAALGNDVQASVLPHAWGYVQTVVLNDLYKLGPGTYDVIVGPRTLEGDAEGANVPATGWPFVEGAATSGTIVRIVP